MDAPPRVLKLPVSIRSLLGFPECVCSCSLLGRANVIAVKVGPGETNKGIYVRIKRDGPGQGEVRLVSLSEPGANG